MQLIVPRNAFVVAGPALAAETSCGVVATVSTPHAHSAFGYSMPFRSIWLAAMSMTLIMKAMAKAQIRLFLTHVCRFFFFGWTEDGQEGTTGRRFRIGGSFTVLLTHYKDVVVFRVDKRKPNLAWGGEAGGASGTSENKSFYTNMSGVPHTSCLCEAQPTAYWLYSVKSNVQASKHKLFPNLSNSLKSSNYHFRLHHSTDQQNKQVFVPQRSISVRKHE